jgi:hypothetical protein
MIFNSFFVFGLLRGRPKKSELPAIGHNAGQMRSPFLLLLCLTSYAFGASSERCLRVSHTVSSHAANIFSLSSAESSLRRSISRAAARAPRAHHGVERALPGQPLFSVDARELRRFRLFFGGGEAVLMMELAAFATRLTSAPLQFVSTACVGAFRFKSDLRNHQAIIQPR